MGMYDEFYASDYDTQLKCFYFPIYNGGDYKRLYHNATRHVGGDLRRFKIRDKLPTKTLYYEYPSNCLIGLYAFEDWDFMTIKKDSFDGFIRINDLTELIVPVYDSYGRKIKVNNLEELQQYVLEYKQNYKPHYDLIWESLAIKWYEKYPLWYQLGELYECWRSKNTYNGIFINEEDLQKYQEQETNIEKDIEEFIKQYPTEYRFYIDKFELNYLIKPGC